MSTIVLIEPGEGNTNNVVVAHGGKAEILAAVKGILVPMELEAYHGTTDHDFIRASNDSLVRMIDAHNAWTPGRYELSPIDPQWKKWTLIIADGDQAFID